MTTPEIPGNPTDAAKRLAQVAQRIEDNLGDTQPNPRDEYPLSSAPRPVVSTPDGRPPRVHLALKQPTTIESSLPTDPDQALTTPFPRHSGRLKKLGGAIVGILKKPAKTTGEIAVDDETPDAAASVVGMPDSSPLAALMFEPLPDAQEQTADPAGPTEEFARVNVAKALNDNANFNEESKTNTGEPTAEPSVIVPSDDGDANGDNPNMQPQRLEGEDEEWPLAPKANTAPEDDEEDYNNLPPSPDFNEEVEEDSNPTTSPSSTSGPISHTNNYRGESGPDAPSAADSDRLKAVLQTKESIDRKQLLERYHKATAEVVDLLSAVAENSMPRSANWSALSKTSSGMSVAFSKDGWEETLPEDVAENGYKHLKVEVMRVVKSQQLVNGLSIEKLANDKQAAHETLQTINSPVGAFKLWRKIAAYDAEIKKLVKAGTRSNFYQDEGEIQVRLVARPSVGEVRKGTVHAIEYKKFAWSIKPDERYLNESKVREIERALRLIRGEPLYGEIKPAQSTDESRIDAILAQGMKLAAQAYDLMGQARQLQDTQDGEHSYGEE